MKHSLSSLLLAAVLPVALVACAPSEAGTTTDGGLSGKLTLTGSSTIAPLALEIAKRFEERHPDVRIDVQTGGSSRGISDAKSGLADIGMASRRLKDGEIELTAHAIAQDGVCMILHASNVVASLTDDQVRAIYLGEIENWSEVGGEDAPITVVNKAAGRATLEVFTKHFGLDEKEIQADVIVGDNEQGIKTVAGNPDSIGYVSIGTAEYSAGSDVAIKLLPANGITASTASVGSGSFPIGRPLNLVTFGEVSKLQRAYIDFCRSAEVHDLVTGLYFVPVRTAQ